MEFSLCAFTGTPYWRFRYRSTERYALILLDPQAEGFAPD